ncbi:hypothetical protein [Marinobacterium lutimaris]|uniref:Uncharacterized protein n=1 Tax=Marinobacterium lutimaris TaxID=568106 RepID=A0A1H5WYJ1_9GAMM|nr:hypothetical protein [Marinobacterium lutimaris]SEG04584.1 hypothetical protein SAMN05444390_1011208 [Marinobacterium lutimaris]
MKKTRRRILLNHRLIQQEYSRKVEEPETLAKSYEWGNHAPPDNLEHPHLWRRQKPAFSRIDSEDSTKHITLWDEIWETL